MHNAILAEISNEILKLSPKIIRLLKEEFIKTKSERITSTKENSIDIGAQDITTPLDHEIGKIYIKHIYERYYKYLQIDSEEESERIGNGKIMLRFDPIDGSKHLFTGFTEIASTAALSLNNITFFALVLDPFFNHTYYAYKDGGAYLNKTKISVNNKSVSADFSFVIYEAPNSRLFKNDISKFKFQSKQLYSVSQVAYRLRNKGLGSTSICLVADGSASAYIDLSSSTKLYDIEAALLIAEEAGAIITTTKGEKISEFYYDAKSEKKEVKENLIVANPTASKEIIKIVNKIQ